MWHSHFLLLTNGWFFLLPRRPAPKPRYLHNSPMSSLKRDTYTGVGLALLAVIIWSGNFIAARGVIREIPPVSLAFYRWLTATIILLPFAYRHARRDWRLIRSSAGYLFWASLSGIALFNTFVYVGAHYTAAINLALIGTTSSPVMAILLAWIFLKEPVGWDKLLGMVLCIAGVLFLIARGSLSNLLAFHFTQGDAWILAAAFCFAMYNTLVRRKPSGISPLAFLLAVFGGGTLLLLPVYIFEASGPVAVTWTPGLILIILYLGAGASVISFLCWNQAVGKLGAGRTALFGNLIPVFSSAEAVLLLGEKFTWIHIVSMLLVFAGILLANRRLFRG